MNKFVSRLDWVLIALYLVAVVGIGIFAGFVRRKGERGGEGGHYFLAGNTLKWPVMIVTSLIYPQPLKDAARDLVWGNWTEPLRVKCGSGLSDYCVTSAMIVVIFALLYIAFR